MDIINQAENLIFKSVDDIPNSFFKYLISYKFKNCGMRYPTANFNLGEIDYFKPKSFEELFPNRNLMILWYNEENSLITDLEIYDIFDDLEMLLNDYEHIIKSIDDGNVHNLRQGDTKYLGAMRLNQKVMQPNSDRPADKRDFVLKKNFLQKILNEIRY